jgi:hypothetical protein
MSLLLQSLGRKNQEMKHLTTVVMSTLAKESLGLGGMMLLNIEWSI